MNPANVKSTMYIDFDKRNHKEDTKFEVDDDARVSKYNDIFANISNWSEELFVIKRIKNVIPWTYVTSDVNREEIFGRFYKKELQKEFRVGKVTKRKCDKLYLKWKDYDNSFNS